MSKTPNTEKHPSKLWWLFAVVILMVFIVIQLPITWVVQRFLPNNQHIQWVSGNIWKGSATWQMPQEMNQAPLSGNIIWKWKPSRLFFGKIAADIEIGTGKTKLKGEMSKSPSSFELQDFSGQIDKATLAAFTGWQVPDAPIKVNKFMILVGDAGIEDASGQLTWVGGQLGYPNADTFMNINLPAMRTDISAEKKGESNALHAHLVNQESKTLGDFYIDAHGMLDVSLTQRMLENVPGYNGSAPKDTPVVTIRQPIDSLGQ